MEGVDVNEEVIFAFLTIAGIVMITGFAISDWLYDCNLRLYEKWGWTSLARRWKTRRSWWLPVCKMICLVLGVIFLLTAFWVLLGIQI